MFNNIPWEITKQISPSRQTIDFVNSYRSWAAFFPSKSTLMVHFSATKILEEETVEVVLIVDGIKKVGVNGHAYESQA